MADAIPCATGAGDSAEHPNGSGAASVASRPAAEAAGPAEARWAELPCAAEARRAELPCAAEAEAEPAAEQWVGPLAGSGVAVAAPPSGVAVGRAAVSAGLLSAGAEAVEWPVELRFWAGLPGGAVRCAAGAA